jgi:hypothetical protein
MNNDETGIDTIVLGSSKDDDTITLSDIFNFDNNDTITLTDYNYSSPLSTSLSTDYSYTATLGTPTSVNSGGSGATLTTTTGGGLMWGNVGGPYTYTGAPGTLTSAGGNWTTYNNQPQVLKVTGNAEFEGEVSIKGVKLDERLNAIEERLGILRPNNDLEGKWEKLKKLGEEYRKLEQEILEGENIWDMLKK